jgi:hypothetical protein
MSCRDRLNTYYANSSSQVRPGRGVNEIKEQVPTLTSTTSVHP